MENKRTVIARKLDVNTMLEALQELYHLGVNYIDLAGQLGEEQDAIFLSFSKEYMDEEFKDNFDQMDAEEMKVKKDKIKYERSFPEDDLNQIS